MGALGVTYGIDRKDDLTPPEGNAGGGYWKGFKTITGAVADTASAPSADNARQLIENGLKQSEIFKFGSD